MESFYYSPRGYWRGSAAIGKLASAAKVKRATAVNWLSKQAIWQIYLPRPSQVILSHFDVTVHNEEADLLFLPHDNMQIYLPRPSQVNLSHFDVTVPIEVHQADLLFLPHDNGYKYALTIVDIASRYKQAEPLKTKSSTEVASVFERSYRRGPLHWPNL